MWLASPSHPSEERMEGEQKFVMVQDYDMIADSDAEDGNSSYGSRPIICLKDTVKLEKQADGNYKLVQ